jgi:hypothetical protein
MIQRFIIAFFLATITAQSWAHEMRPGFLEITGSHAGNL